MQDRWGQQWGVQTQECPVAVHIATTADEMSVSSFSFGRFKCEGFAGIAIKLHAVPGTDDQRRGARQTVLGDQGCGAALIVVSCVAVFISLTGYVEFSNA